MANPFDQFDKTASSNPFDQFDHEWKGRKPDPSLTDVATDAAWQLPQGFNRGVDSLINLPYNLVRGAAGLAGYELPEAKPIVGQLNSGRKPETTTGRYAESVGEALGASALPSAGLVAKAGQLAKLAPLTTGRAVAQHVGETIAANPGSAILADTAAATGSGVGSEASKEAGASPAVQTLAGFAGAMAPLGIGTLVSRGTHAVQAARASADPYARIAKGLGDQPLDDVVESLAVGTTRANQDLNRRVFETLGDEMVKANGDRSVAIPATLKRLEVEGNVAPSTAQDQLRRVVNAQSGSDLMLGEYPAVARSNLETRRQNPANIADEDAASTTFPGTQRLMDYVANTGSLASSQNVRNAVGQRAEGLKASTDAAVASMSPNGKTIQDVATLLDNAAKQASQEYNVVHTTPGLVDTPKLQNGMQNLVNAYEAKAGQRAGEQGDALRSALKEFFVPTPNGPQLVPTLQMVQDARGALRGIITRNRNAGNDHIVSTLKPIYDDVTQVMRDASPSWSKVNDKWADLALKDKATELGDAFSKSAGPKYREQIAEYKKLAPEAQDIVGVHFAQNMLDMIENAWKLGGAKNLGELFAKAHVRDMIRTVLGDEAAVKTARMIRDANVMARTRDMMKGSPTQPRQQMQKEQDADINLMTAAENFDWKNWRQAIFDSAKAFWRERRNKVMGRVLTTPVRNTPAVAEHMARMRRAMDVANKYATKPIRQPAIAGHLGPVFRASDDNR